MENQSLVVSDTPFISRIDRSIADNLDAIKKSYGADADIVKDIIIFISRNLKRDLFGFSTFTMADFSKVSGRRRQELTSKHSYLLAPGTEPVEYSGHQFVSVFDYVLYQMQLRNIIFSKNYKHTDQGKTLDMVGIQVIKQVKITTDKSNANRKIYQIRLSDEFLDGFINRYYTLEVNGYPKVGKGRGGDGRKSLYLFLYKAMHLNLSQHNNKSWFTVDYLCKICDVNFAEPKERKRVITKYLDLLIEKGGLRITYEFVQKQGNEFASIRGYWIKVNFAPIDTIQLQESKGEHHFYHKLLNGLKDFFKSVHGKGNYDFGEEEADPFQRWLTNSLVDRDNKIDIFIKCYRIAYQKNISQDVAQEMMFQYWPS
ncbi:MAG: hypothetical protein ABIO02_00595 [Patescibacteria group bacterium]